MGAPTAKTKQGANLLKFALLRTLADIFTNVAMEFSFCTFLRQISYRDFAHCCRSSLETRLFYVAALSLASNKTVNGSPL
jgi:hypothetical protein